MNRVSDQSTDVLQQVKTFRAKVKEQRARLQNAHVQQAKLVAQRSAEKASIEGQLASRQQLLSSIKSEIAQMQAAEEQRQAELAAQARARLASNGVTVLNASAGAVTQPAPVYTPPPAKYGGVVGIAMQYLGVPYVYGGASPERVRLLGSRDVRLRADRRVASAQRGRAVRGRHARFA